MTRVRATWECEDTIDLDDLTRDVLVHLQSFCSECMVHGERLDNRVVSAAYCVGRELVDGGYNADNFEIDFSRAQIDKLTSSVYGGTEVSNCDAQLAALDLTELLLGRNIQEILDRFGDKRSRFTIETDLKLGTFVASTPSVFVPNPHPEQDRLEC